MFLRHEYVVFETKKYWWSIEKMAHNGSVWIQRSPSFSSVAAWFRGEERIQFWWRIGNIYKFGYFPFVPPPPPPIPVRYGPPSYTDCVCYSMINHYGKMCERASGYGKNMHPLSLGRTNGLHPEI